MKTLSPLSFPKALDEHLAAHLAALFSASSDTRRIRIPSVLRRLAAAGIVLALFYPAGPTLPSLAGGLLNSNAAASDATGDWPSDPWTEFSGHGDESEVLAVLSLPEIAPGLGLTAPPVEAHSAGPARPPLRPPAR